MKCNLRPAIWAVALAIAVTALGTPQFAVAYQSQRGMERGRGHNKDQNRGTDTDIAKNPNYQRGWSHGQEDGANNRARRYRLRLDNDAARRAYQAGYDQGYQDRNRRVPPAIARPTDRTTGRMPGTGGVYRNQASQIGYQDGVNDGRSDRQTGHSFRPTQGDNYKNASRGYNSSLGGLNQYKQLYRQGYGPGYQEGYNGQGSGIRR